jgi:hypothetical protein
VLEHKDENDGCAGKLDECVSWLFHSARILPIDTQFHSAKRFCDLAFKMFGFLILCLKE